jgi:hypothetical protein
MYSMKYGSDTVCYLQMIASASFRGNVFAHNFFESPDMLFALDKGGEKQFLRTRPLV